MFFNPMEHSRIATRDAIKIDANHMVVVYQSLKNRVERRIIQGPQLFVPAAEEWYLEHFFYILSFLLYIFKHYSFYISPERHSHLLFHYITSLMLN